MWKNTYANLVRNNFSAKSVKQVMDLLFNTTHRHMVSISCAYWSENVNGDSLLVSGKIYLPKNRNLRGIVVVNHYTITTNYEAPSNLFQMDCIYAMKDYAVVMPDYEGYGLSADEQHPYLHWRSAAKTAIDLLDCMPDILDYYGYTYPNDVVITGYSQGGAVALGVARMLEEEPSDRWTIRKLYAGAGPYDPAATYDYCVERDSMGIPGAIPMIVMGMSAAYDLNFQLEDFFLEPLLSNYDEWVVSKQYTVSQIGELMGSTRMTELMLPQALDRQNELTELLYNALKENSNVGYNLQSPAYFMHSIDDDIVPIINSLELQQQMPDSSNVVYDFGHYGTHMGGAVLFTKYVYQDL
jgi:pimeloyl-ACP methyl ester carboxylesterase